MGQDPEVALIANLRNHAFLSGFMKRLNERFPEMPAKLDDPHRKVHLTTSRITDILCHCEHRYHG